MGKHNIPMTRRSLSAGGISLTRRPKRNVSIKTYDDTVGLSRTEERELKKALYASLQESKRLFRYQQECYQHESRERPMSHSSNAPLAQRPSRPTRSRSWPHTPSQSSTATPSTNASVDESSQDSVKSSVSSMAELKNKQERKIHAQRKFAQGSLPPTPSTTPVKVKASPIKLLPKTAKTEDFLTFLCLRGSSVLPPHLDFFNFSRGEPSHGEISAPQTPPPSEPNTKPSERTRESTPESSSVSTNDELYEIGTPSPSSLIIMNGRNGLSARKAARASASTPETARGIVSLSQGLTKKTTRVSTPHRGRKYGTVEKTPSPRKGSLVRGQLTPSKRGFAVKSLSPQFSKTAQEKKLSLKQKALLSFLPRKTSTKLGTASSKAAGSKQLMLEGTEQVNNKPVVCLHAALRRSTRLQSVNACTQCKVGMSASVCRSAHITCTDSVVNSSCSKSVKKLMGRKQASTCSHKLGDGSPSHSVENIMPRNCSQTFVSFCKSKNSMKSNIGQFSVTDKNQQKIPGESHVRGTLNETLNVEGGSRKDSGNKNYTQLKQPQLTTVSTGELCDEAVGKLWSLNSEDKDMTAICRSRLLSAPSGLSAFTDVYKDHMYLKSVGLVCVGYIPVYGQRQPETGKNNGIIDQLDDDVVRRKRDRSMFSAVGRSQDEPGYQVCSEHRLQVKCPSLMTRSSKEQEERPNLTQQSLTETKSHKSLLDDISRIVYKMKDEKKSDEKEPFLLLSERTGKFVTKEGNKINIKKIPGRAFGYEVTHSLHPSCGLETSVQHPGREMGKSKFSTGETKVLRSEIGDVSSPPNSVYGSEGKVSAEKGVGFHISEYDIGRSRNPIAIDSDSEEESSSYESRNDHSDRMGNLSTKAPICLKTSATMSKNAMDADNLLKNKVSYHQLRMNDTHVRDPKSSANEDNCQISSSLAALISLCSGQQQRTNPDIQIGAEVEQPIQDAHRLHRQEPVEMDSHQISSVLKALVELCTIQRHRLDPDTQVGGGEERVAQEVLVEMDNERSDSVLQPGYSVLYRGTEELDQDQVVPHIYLKSESDAVTFWRSGHHGQSSHIVEREIWDGSNQHGQALPDGTGLREDCQHGQALPDRTGLREDCQDVDVTELCYVEEDGSEWTVTIYTAKKEPSTVMSKEEYFEQNMLPVGDVEGFPSDNFGFDHGETGEVGMKIDAKLDASFVSDVKGLLHEFESTLLSKPTRQSTCNTKEMSSEVLEQKDDSFEMYMQNLPPECIIQKQGGNPPGINLPPCSSHLSSLLEDSGDFNTMRDSDIPLAKQSWTSTRNSQFCEEKTILDPKIKSLSHSIFTRVEEGTTELEQQQLLEIDEDHELLHNESVSFVFSPLQDGTDLDMSVCLVTADENYMCESLYEDEHYSGRSDYLHPSHSCDFKDLVWPQIPTIANYPGTDCSVEKTRSEICKDEDVIVNDSDEMCQDVFMGPDIENIIPDVPETMMSSDKTKLDSYVTKGEVKQPESKTSEITFKYDHLAADLETSEQNEFEYSCISGNPPVPVKMMNAESCLPFKKRAIVAKRQNRKEGSSLDSSVNVKIPLPTPAPASSVEECFRVKKQGADYSRKAASKKEFADIPLYPWTAVSRPGSINRAKHIAGSQTGKDKTYAQKFLHETVPKETSCSSRSGQTGHDVFLMSRHKTDVLQPLSTECPTNPVPFSQRMQSGSGSSHSQFIPLDTMLGNGQGSSEISESQTHFWQRNSVGKTFVNEVIQDLSKPPKGRTEFWGGTSVPDHDPTTKETGKCRPESEVDLFCTRSDKMEDIIHTTGASYTGNHDIGSPVDLFCKSRTPKKVSHTNPNFMEVRLPNPEDSTYRDSFHSCQTSRVGQKETGVDTWFQDNDSAVKPEPYCSPLVVKVLDSARSVEKENYGQFASSSSACLALSQGKMCRTEIGQLGCVTSPSKQGVKGEDTDTDQNYAYKKSAMVQSNSGDLEIRTDNSESALSDLVEQLRFSKNLIKMGRKTSLMKTNQIVPSLDSSQKDAFPGRSQGSVKYKERNKPQAIEQQLTKMARASYKCIPLFPNETFHAAADDKVYAEGQSDITPVTSKVKNKSNCIPRSIINPGKSNCEIGCQTGFMDEKEDFVEDEDMSVKLKQKTKDGTVPKTYEYICRPRVREMQRAAGVTGSFEYIPVGPKSGGKSSWTTVSQEDTSSIYECNSKLNDIQSKRAKATAVSQGHATKTPNWKITGVTQHRATEVLSSVIGRNFDSNRGIQCKKIGFPADCQYGMENEVLSKTDFCLKQPGKHDPDLSKQQNPLSVTSMSCYKIDSSDTRPWLVWEHPGSYQPSASESQSTSTQTCEAGKTLRTETVSQPQQLPAQSEPSDRVQDFQLLGDSVQLSSQNTVYRPNKLFPPPPSVMSCGVCKGSQPSHQTFKPVNPASHKRATAAASKQLKAKLKKKKEMAKQKLSGKVKKKVFLKNKPKSKVGKRQKGSLEEHPKKKRIVRRSSLRLKELTKALKAQRKRRRRPVEAEEEEEDEVTISLHPPSRPVGKRRNFAPRPIGGEVTEMPRAVTEEFDFEICTDDEDDEVSFGNISSFRRTFGSKKSARERAKKVKPRKVGVSTRSSSQKTQTSAAKIVATKCLSAVKKLRAPKKDQIKLSKIIERRRKLKQDETKGDAARRGRRPAGVKKSVTPEKQSRSESLLKSDQPNLLEVPTFRPTEEEFRDPIQYIESIREKAEPFGMCQIIPPSSWKCESKINDEMRFTAQVQHVHRLYKRWGPNVQITSSVSKHLDSIGADLEPHPQIGGVEVDLCKLSQTIHEFGGMQNNVDKKKWVKIADAMKIPKLAQDRGMRLYDVYCKYLLPYDTLSAEERSRIEQSVISDRQKKVKAGKVDDDDAIVKGRSNPLSTFIRVARNVRSMWFKDEPTPEQVESEYWKLLEERTNHVAVQCGHVSTSTQGSGFPSKKDSPYSRHGWNLNNLSENPKCILRCLGPVSGATIPTLHIGMMFATSCWCTDIHHLPYIQYLHTGVDIVWYSIPKQQENKFKAAMKDLVPSLVSDDPRWLKEDTVMVYEGHSAKIAWKRVPWDPFPMQFLHYDCRKPMVNPARLTARGVTVARCVQKPKTFVAIFPKSYTATINCGYNVSESVHYATRRWISAGVSVAEDLSKSVEPELFSMDALLSHLISDPTTDIQTLKVAVPFFEKVLSRELSQRKQLMEAGLKPSKRGGMSEDMPSPPSRKRSIDQVEENVCDVSKKHCFFSRVVNESENLTLSLEEGLKHVQKKKNLKHCKLNFRYTEEELKSMLQSAQCRLDICGNSDGGSGGKKRGMKK